MNGEIFSREQELRRKAALYRRVASAPTQGGTTADWVLIALAERLEREAETTAPPQVQDMGVTERR